MVTYIIMFYPYTQNVSKTCYRAENTVRESCSEFWILPWELFHQPGQASSRHSGVLDTYSNTTWLRNWCSQIQIDTVPTLCVLPSTCLTWSHLVLFQTGNILMGIKIWPLLVNSLMCKSCTQRWACPSPLHTRHSWKRCGLLTQFLPKILSLSSLVWLLRTHTRCTVVYQWLWGFFKVCLASFFKSYLWFYFLYRIKRLTPSLPNNTTFPTATLTKVKCTLLRLSPTHSYFPVYILKGSKNHLNGGILCR